MSFLAQAQKITLAQPFCWNEACHAEPREIALNQAQLPGNMDQISILS